MHHEICCRVWINNDKVSRQQVRRGSREETSRDLYLERSTCAFRNVCAAHRAHHADTKRTICAELTRNMSIPGSKLLGSSLSKSWHGDFNDLFSFVQGSQSEPRENTESSYDVLCSILTYRCSAKLAHGLSLEMCARRSKNLQEHRACPKPQVSGVPRSQWSPHRMTIWLPILILIWFLIF